MILKVHSEAVCGLYTPAQIPAAFPAHHGPASETAGSFQHRALYQSSVRSVSQCENGFAASCLKCRLYCKAAWILD